MKSTKFAFTQHGYFQGAPFLWVGITYLYGTQTNLTLEYEGIDKKYGTLDVALELDMELLKWADRNNLGLLKDIFMIAALEALLQVCKKYNQPLEPILAERTKYGPMPTTLEECKAYPVSNPLAPPEDDMPLQE